MILLCGDPHGKFAHIIDAVDELQPDAIVLLGDMQAQQPLERVLAPILDRTEIWFIPGNHDTDSEADHDHLFGSTLIDRNLHGRIVEIAGVRIAGLGGVFRGKVWGPPANWAYESPAAFLRSCPRQEHWRGGLPRKHRSTIFPSDYFELVGQRADVLVTHEAPSCHPYGFAAIDELAKSLQVTHAFHGHHHVDYQTKLDGFTAIGVGLRAITALDGTVIRPSDVDRSARMRAHMAETPAIQS